MGTSLASIRRGVHSGNRPASRRQRYLSFRFLLSARTHRSVPEIFNTDRFGECFGSPIDIPFADLAVVAHHFSQQAHFAHVLLDQLIQFARLGFLSDFQLL